jgi:hemoglobin
VCWIELPDDALLRSRVIEHFDWDIERHVSVEPVGTDLGDPGPTPSGAGTA